MAGIIETVPQIAWLGKNKVWVFLFAGLMIALSGFAVARKKRALSGRPGKGESLHARPTHQFDRLVGKCCSVYYW